MDAPRRAKLHLLLRKPSAEVLGPGGWVGLGSPPSPPAPPVRLDQHPRDPLEEHPPEEQEHLATSTSSSGSSGPVLWSALPQELLSMVVKTGGSQAVLALAVSQVCSSWRRAVASDPRSLRQLQFRLVRLRPPADPSTSLPQLVDCAVRAGNMAAAIVAARHIDAVRCRLGSTAAKHAAYDAARCWTRAAKLGHPEAQYRVGIASYKVSGHH